MSGEFGGCYTGYMHTQAAGAMEDIESAREPDHRALLPLYEAMYALARRICWVEACDSSADPEITLRLLQQVRASVDASEIKLVDVLSARYLPLQRLVYSDAKCPACRTECYVYTKAPQEEGKALQTRYRDRLECASCGKVGFVDWDEDRPWNTLFTWYDPEDREGE